ncbi:MAG: stage II sporulation protein P, partial [Bacillota bacterium]|nr:stage II sporulation protein P [Bacillota bacterium]
MRRKSKKLTAILVFATAFFVVMELSSTQNLYILRASVSEKSAPIVHLDRTENVISGLCSQIGKFFTGLSGSLSYATAVSANYVVPDESVCASEIEKTASAKTTAAPQKEVATPETAPKAEETQTVEKNINSSSGNIALSKGITIKNQTKYSVNTKQIIGRGIPFSFSGSPQVLILHTHGTESYTPSQQYNFKYTSNSRTTDDNYNVVRVGTELTNYLKSMGISVVHDTTLYDYPDYNSSYDNAFGGIKAMLKKYPSISVVIDLHRDAINSNSGEKIKLTGDVNGEKAAQ